MVDKLHMFDSKLHVFWLRNLRPCVSLGSRFGLKIRPQESRAMWTSDRWPLIQMFSEQNRHAMNARSFDMF